MAQQPANHVAAAERAARQGDLLGVHLLFPGALIGDRAEAGLTARFRASYALVKMALSALGALGALGAPCFVLPAGGSATNVGWTVGGGVEGAIPNMSNWTWKLEYLYIDFGTVSGNNVDAFVDLNHYPYSWGTRVTDNIFRGGLNYRFW